MWPRATNPENWLPQSQFIKVISTVRVRRTGGSEIHERVAQLFVVVHSCARYSSRTASTSAISKLPFRLLEKLTVSFSSLEHIIAWIRVRY